MKMIYRGTKINLAKAYEDPLKQIADREIENKENLQAVNEKEANKILSKF